VKGGIAPPELERFIPKDLLSILTYGRALSKLLVLYTESGKYLLHRVWYIYEQEVKGGHFPGLRNLKESFDVVFILINIMKSIFRIRYI